MWTEETLKKAAEEYFEKYHEDGVVIYKRDTIAFFIAGAKYIINNTQN